jgi:hypothetical protein
MLRSRLVILQMLAGSLILLCDLFIKMVRIKFLLCLLTTVVASSIINSRSHTRFTTFSTSQHSSILTVILNNPVMVVNEFSEIMSFELDQLVISLQTDNSTKVILFWSNN